MDDRNSDDGERETPVLSTNVKRHVRMVSLGSTEAHGEAMTLNDFRKTRATYHDGLRLVGALYLPP